MASRQDLREIEDDCPWLREDFQAGLIVLSDSVAEQARRFAAEMVVLAELTAMVPRCPFDESGATPWTSFRREVAVARTVSDRAAAADIRASVALTTRLPRTLELLHAGQVTVARARVVITELEGVDEAVARMVDAELADRVTLMSAARIRQEVRRAVLTADPDEAARRTAEKNDGRDVIFMPDTDDQASVVITGPAVPVARWYQTLDQRARALKAAGDPRTLAQLKFDLAVTDYPCAVHAPADPTQDARQDADQVATAAAVVAAPRLEDDKAAAEGGLRPSFTEPASTDCRKSRPVQASIGVPVETGLGLSNEPGWLDGYGWISAPTCRLLLVDAELRRVCVRSGTGELVDRAERGVRPPPTYVGLRHALLDMVVDEITLTGAAGRVEDQHDPSPGLRELVQQRDRFDDGPTGTMVRASACDLDHDRPWPAGPTAAWNLVARSDRTHGLKHYGWTPLRTPTSTLWFSPAGQCIEVPRHQQPPPGIDTDDRPAVLPDPDELVTVDLAQLQPSTDQDPRPWIRDLPQDTTPWTWITDEEGPLPF